MPNKTTTFMENSTLFINTVSSKSDKVIPTPFYVLRLYFRQSFRHCSEFSFPGAFIFGQKTDSEIQIVRSEVYDAGGEATATLTSISGNFRVFRYIEFKNILFSFLFLHISSFVFQMFAENVGDL